MQRDIRCNGKLSGKRLKITMEYFKNISNKLSRSEWWLRGGGWGGSYIRNSSALKKTIMK